MEDELDEIANGKLKWEKTIKDFWNPFDKKLIDVEKNAKRVKIEVEKLGKNVRSVKTENWLSEPEDLVNLFPVRVSRIANIRKNIWKKLELNVLSVKRGM